MIKVGDTVKVTIDRPMGSAHPEYPDLVYREYRDRDVVCFEN